MDLFQALANQPPRPDTRRVAETSPDGTADTGFADAVNQEAAVQQEASKKASGEQQPNAQASGEQAGDTSEGAKADAVTLPETDVAEETTLKKGPSLATISAGEGPAVSGKEGAKIEIGTVPRETTAVVTSATSTSSVQGQERKAIAEQMAQVVRPVGETPQGDALTLSEVGKPIDSARSSATEPVSPAETKAAQAPSSPADGRVPVENAPLANSTDIASVKPLRVNEVEATLASSEQRPATQSAGDVARRTQADAITPVRTNTVPETSISAKQSSDAIAQTPLAAQAVRSSDKDAATRIVSVRSESGKPETTRMIEPTRQANLPLADTSTPGLAYMERAERRAAHQNLVAASDTVLPATAKNATAPKPELPLQPMAKPPGVQVPPSTTNSIAVATNGAETVTQVSTSAAPLAAAQIQTAIAPQGLAYEHYPGLVERSVAPQLTAAAATRSNGGIVEVLLDPPELGRVEIMMELSDQGLRATLSAERQATIDLLRRHLDVLAQQFEEAGFADVDLGFTSFAESQTQADDDGTSQSEDFSKSDDRMTSTISATPGHNPRPEGLVDIRL
ncbi:MAG: flagellar hook-length control protein FliK [Paracoccaceae bacterium]